MRKKSNLIQKEEFWRAVFTHSETTTTGKKFIYTQSSLTSAIHNFFMTFSSSFDFFLYRRRRHWKAMTQTHKKKRNKK